MTLDELLQQFSNLTEIIHDNRKTIAGKIDENQRARGQLDEVKQKIVEYVDAERKQGKSLYRICLESFGIIDKRFYALNALLKKALDRK